MKKLIILLSFALTSCQNSVFVWTFSDIAGLVASAVVLLIVVVAAIYYWVSSVINEYKNNDKP